MGRHDSQIRSVGTEKARDSVGLVATRLVETVQHFPVTRFRQRGDPLWADITLKSDAAMQLVARS